VAVAVAWAANKPADREQLDHWPSIVRLLGRLPHFATLLSILCHTLLYSVILQLTSERPKRQSHRQTHGQRRAITHQRRRVAGERKPVGSCTCTCISICRPMTVAARLPTVFGGCRLSRRERERERESWPRSEHTNRVEQTNGHFGSFATCSNAHYLPMLSTVQAAHSTRIDWPPARHINQLRFGRLMNTRSPAEQLRRPLGAQPAADCLPQAHSLPACTFAPPASLLLPKLVLRS